MRNKIQTSDDSLDQIFAFYDFLHMKANLSTMAEPAGYPSTLGCYFWAETLRTKKGNDWTRLISYKRRGREGYGAKCAVDSESHGTKDRKLRSRNCHRYIIR